MKISSTGHCDEESVAPGPVSRRRLLLVVTLARSPETRVPRTRVAHRVHRALTEFGAPTHLVTPEEFLPEDFIFYFGTPPWRVDILTSIPGVDFEDAFQKRSSVDMGGFNASVISKADLSLPRSLPAGLKTCLMSRHLSKANSLGYSFASFGGVRTNDHSI